MRLDKDSYDRGEVARSVRDETTSVRSLLCVLCAVSRRLAAGGVRLASFRAPATTESHLISRFAVLKDTSWPLFLS